MGAASTPKEAVIDATEAAARLKAAGELGGQDLKVTLIECAAKPRVGVTPRIAPKPRVTIGSIRLEHVGGD